MQIDRTSGISLHIQVSNLLISRILDGEWPIGGMLPSEPLLCAQFGISRGTLRQALTQLHNSGYVRREQGRGTFVARGQVRQNQSDLPGRTLAFLVPYVLDSFAPSLLMGVEHKAKEHGYSVLFHHVENSLARQAETLARLKQTGVAGIVLYPVDSIHVDQAILRIQEDRHPLVVLDRYFKHLTTDYVTADNFGGALRATQHLVALGHQRIGFLTSAEPAVTMEHRQLGYRQALIEAGLALNPDDTWGIECYPTMDMTPLVQVLTSAQRPTAILAASDRLALALYKTCRALRIAIPDDLAIIGFGDFGISAHLDPPLTSVALPTREMGQKAAEVVIGRIDQTIVGPQQHMLPTNLVVRASCGATEAQRSPDTNVYSFSIDQSLAFATEREP